MMDARVPISEVMTKEAATISERATIREAARKMRDAGVGSLLVTINGGKLAGIVTETDLVEKVLANGTPSDQTVGAVMTRDPVTIHEKGDITEALRVMSKHDIRRLPVMRDGHLVGIVTEKDIARIAPSLLEIVSDLSTFERRLEPGETAVEGYCEECGNEDANLRVVEGEAVCAECYQRVVEAGTES